MGFLPKTSSLLLRKPRNKSIASAETNGTLLPKSGIHGDELEISSKKLDGVVALNSGTGNMHLVNKTLSGSLPILYAGSSKNSLEEAKPVLAHSLFDMFKKHNKDPTGEYRKEQWVPMRGIHSGTCFSDQCRTGKLSVNFNKNYAACIPKQSTKLVVGYNAKQSNLCAQDIKVVPGLLCIGVENVIYTGADFVSYGETSIPLLPENIELESQSLPSQRTKQSKDAAKIGNECGLTLLPNLELPGKKYPSNSRIISLSSDSPDIQSTNDLSVIINKSEQDSPVSVLEQLFEDASPRLADANTKSVLAVKPPFRPRRINFEERSPSKQVKLHQDTTSRISIPSKKNIFWMLEYTKNVLETSGLNLYQLALKWDNSTHMLDSVIYTMMENSQTATQIVRSLETHLLFDHINEVLLDTYQPYHGFYPWIPISRPNKPHIVKEKTFFDDILKTVEMNLVCLHHKLSEQLVIHSMEKCGTWIDTRRDLEDMVLEITEDVAEELVDEFVFEMWID